VDQEELAISPLVNQMMLRENIQTLESNSLMSNSVSSTLPTMEDHPHQDQPHQVQLQDAQEETFLLALVSAHLPQLLLSKLASKFAPPDANLLRLSSNEKLAN
jgi:hypothetical protein